MSVDGTDFIINEPTLSIEHGTAINFLGLELVMKFQFLLKFPRLSRLADHGHAAPTVMSVYSVTV